MKIGNINIKKSFLIAGVIAFLICIILIILLTQDKSVKLNCTSNEKISSVDSSSQFNIVFKNDAMKLVTSKNKVLLTTDEYKENIDLLFNSLQDQYKDIKEDKGVIIKTSKTENSVSLEITVDAKKSPDQVSKVGSSIQSNMNYETAKKTLERLGYICK